LKALNSIFDFVAALAMAPFVVLGVIAYIAIVMWPVWVAIAALMYIFG